MFNLCRFNLTTALTLTLVMMFLLTSTIPARAADLFFTANPATGSDTNPGTMSLPLLTPTRAMEMWNFGDRIWLVGPNYKLLVQFGAADKAFIEPLNADVVVILRRGYKIKTVPVTTRKTDVSTTAPVTINKNTKFRTEVKD